MKDMIARLHVTLKALHDAIQRAMGWLDGHLHQFEISGILYGEPSPLQPALSGIVYPRLVEGARRGPPEGIGGPWGYAEFLEAIADPKHERHAELTQRGRSPGFAGVAVGV